MSYKFDSFIENYETELKSLIKKEMHVHYRQNMKQNFNIHQQGKCRTFLGPRNSSSFPEE